jgi:DNA-directed RNA polymerase subunit RPC12/RpoP
LLQIDNPDYPGGANVMSVNQMKKWWNYKTSFNKNFVWTDEDPCGDYRARLFWDTCPICGEKLNVNKLDIDSPDYEGDYDGVRCTKCGWIRDLVQAVEPDMKDGLNKLSVNEYKKEYLSKKGGKD